MSHSHHLDVPFLSEDAEDSSTLKPFFEERGVSTWLLDNVELTTVGVDVGSSTTHLVFSRLHLQRLAQSLSSRFVVVERHELYRSPILLTPFARDGLIDVTILSKFIDESYSKAGVQPSEVDTGVVILTGVALERANARAVAELFASDGGRFVCASAGHNLEGILAAHGSGAVAMSRRKHVEMLHIDIGGGTSKLALIKDGEVLETSAISVGARLLAFDENNAPIRIESAAHLVADNLGIQLSNGVSMTSDDKLRFAQVLANALITTALGEPQSELAKKLMLTPTLSAPPARSCLFSFSGGVSEYLFERETHVFEDMAMYLTQALRDELEERGITVISPGEGIRATAIGASQFTVQLSGSTILITDRFDLPIHNIPVVRPILPESLNRETVSASLKSALARLDLDQTDVPLCVYLPWQGDAEYTSLFALAAGLSDTFEVQLGSTNQPLVLALEADMGAALGRILQEELGYPGPLISIDGVELRELDYIDLGVPLQPSGVLPVMVKSLAFPIIGV